MPVADDYHGLVTGVRAQILGDSLAVAADPGDSFRVVYETADFDEDGGAVGQVLGPSAGRQGSARVDLADRAVSGNSWTTCGRTASTSYPTRSEWKGVRRNHDRENSWTQGPEGRRTRLRRPRTQPIPGRPEMWLLAVLIVVALLTCSMPLPAPPRHRARSRLGSEV
jgi:hypothetical protein